MSGRRVVILALSGMVLARPPAFAQTPTVPVSLAQCPLALPDVIVTLTSHYQSGDWAAFQKYATTVLKSAQTTCPLAQSESAEALKAVKAINPFTDYVVMTWVAKNQFAESTLYSALVHSATEAYSSTLPGVGAGGPKLFQVFVSPLDLDALAAVYVSVRENNPWLRNCRRSLRRSSIRCSPR